MYFAEKPEDLLDQEGLLSMSGLEFMQGILDGTLPAPPISRVLNYRLYSVEEGRVAFRGTPGFDHTNPMGTVHGGWYGTLVDSCMACAVMTLVPKGSVYTTLEFKTNIIRPIKLGTEIEAVGTSQHTGRSTGVAVAELRGVEDGKLYATGSTTCIVMKMR
ncbi:PaaI family thioesterase [Aliiroseovarius sp.]|uniref:PaaI family thioesterase n=1 Tax=Aliiroseovarius sp. TaxID=1872442 RepID=UPI003BA90D56